MNQEPFELTAQYCVCAWVSLSSINLKKTAALAYRCPVPLITLGDLFTSYSVPCLRRAASIEEEYEAAGMEVLLDNEDNDGWLATHGKPKGKLLWLKYTNNFVEPLTQTISYL